MKDTSEFRRHAEETLHSLHRHLAPSADDYGFTVEVGPAGLEIEFDTPGEPVKVTIHPAQQQVWVASGSATERLVWDVVENAFVLEETGQTLQELLGEAVSERVGEDVSF